jgi:MFS family permease
MSPARQRGGWPVVAAAAVGLAVGFSVYISYVFGLFILPLEAAFGWSRAEITFALTLTTWTVVVASPIVGWLLDRYGPRRLLLPSVLGLAAIVSALAAQSGDLRLFYALHLLLPLIAAGTLPVVYTRAVVGWFEERRGLALGLALSGVGLGALLLPSIIQAAISAGGWRAGYLAFAAPMVLIALPTLFLFFRDRGDAVRELPGVATPPAPGYSFSQAIRTPAFWMLIVIFTALGIMTLGIAVSIAPMLGDRGYSPAAVGGFASALGAGVLLGRLAAGALIDRLPPGLVAFACLGASAAGLLLLGSDIPAAGVTSALLLAGFGIGAEFDFMSYFISCRFGLRAYGRLYGWIYSAFQLGCGVGPLLMAMLQARTGNYTTGLGVLAACAAGAGCLFVVLGRDLRSAGPDPTVAPA